MLRNSLIWLLALIIALVSGLTALGAISKSKAPEIAVGLQPFNGFAAEKIVSRRIKASLAADRGEFPKELDELTKHWAKLAFLHEPITPEAVAILAMAQTGETRRALMLKALQLSRRENVVALWLIQDSANRKDLSAVLRYYDTMLRTTPANNALIISILVEALSNDSALGPFTEMLSTSPPWAATFWEKAAATPKAIVNAALLRKNLHRPEETVESYRDGALISALVAEMKFETATNLYNMITAPRTGNEIISNGFFKQRPQYPPLDWHLISTGSHGAFIANNTLQLSTLGKTGGLFARQLVKLPEAVFEIRMEMKTPIPTSAELFVSIACAEKIPNIPTVIRIPLSALVTKQKISTMATSCRYYWLDIAGRSIGNNVGMDVALESISMKELAVHGR